MKQYSWTTIFKQKQQGIGQTTLNIPATLWQLRIVTKTIQMAGIAKCELCSCFLMVDYVSDLINFFFLFCILTVGLQWNTKYR